MLSCEVQILVRIFLRNQNEASGQQTGGLFVLAFVYPENSGKEKASAGCVLISVYKCECYRGACSKVAIRSPKPRGQVRFLSPL